MVCSKISREMEPFIPHVKPNLKYSIYFTLLFHVLKQHMHSNLCQPTQAGTFCHSPPPNPVTHYQVNYHFLFFPYLPFCTCPIKSLFEYHWFHSVLYFFGSTEVYFSLIVNTVRIPDELCGNQAILGLQCLQWAIIQNVSGLFQGPSPCKLSINYQ